MTQINTLPPIVRLNQLQGLDIIREQFEKYRATYKRYVEGKVHGRFRPHMVLIGNPGTGKTTVARLFAEILYEEGLLPQGQFIEATPSDLVSQYIGQTRVKAAALCDRAKGGVLFIDEAYGLMSDFGQEAIEALIKFMEDERDTIVILAGYTNEMRDMINDIPCLQSRFTNEFVFKDFDPNDLFEILMSKLGEHETSENFKSNMRQIIQIQFEHRDPNRWGNARTMEDYATEVLRNFIVKHNATGIIDADCIPDFLNDVFNQ